MKIKLFFLLVLLVPFMVDAQVGIGTNTPDNSAALHINSVTNNRGVLFPRMTVAQRNAIVAPANGLFIYQIDNNPGIYYYDTPTTSWKSVAADGWGLLGNSGINPATNFLGTLDDQSLVLKTNNVERMRILGSSPASTAGYVGIGTATPTANLHIFTPGGLSNSNFGFEENSISPFTRGGTDLNWDITNTAGEFFIGGRGIRSNNQVDNSTNFFEYVTPTIPAGGSTVSFSLRVSSESGFDFLRFFIDGVQQAQWSGDIPFTTVSYPIAAGAPKTLRWQYSKDGSVSTLLDRAFVDNITVPAILRAVRINDGAQANGLVLLSDATGAGTWSPPGAFPTTSWLTAGNGATNPSTNFLGTTNNFPLDFRVNSTTVTRMRVLPNGNVGIGIVAPTSKLHVVGIDSVNPIINARNSNITNGTTSRGLQGEARATFLGSAGITGVSVNRGSNEIGVLGDYSDTVTSWGAGVLGTGVGGTVNDLNFSPVLFDFGVAGTVDSAVGTGVYGKNVNTSAGGYGLYSQGNFVVIGDKPASIPTTKGNQLVHCIENPEIYFEDLGSGKLVNGICHIRFDDLFLETIFIDETHKAILFLQEEGETNGLTYVFDADNNGFTVTEKENGRSTTDFTYRIFAKRRFYQDHRFGVDGAQPLENNLVKHKNVPVTSTDPQVVKKFVENYIKLDRAKNESK